jgi:DNA modification methylase
MNIHREFAMPSRWTFNIKPIAELLENEMSDGLWVDPFAGKNSPADITNDLNPELDTDYTKKADDFLSMFDENEVDGGILLDPPYNATQLKRLYDDLDIDVEQDDTNSKFYAKPRNHAERILSEGAKAISFGWNSVGVGKTRGFEKQEILLVCHGSSRNDTIVVVETNGNIDKNDRSVFDY